MKKFSFLVALTMGLVAASCSSDEPMANVTDSAKTQINYTVTADNGSRSCSSYQNGTDVNSMYVSAWMTASSVLPGYGSPNTGNADYFTNDKLDRSSTNGTSKGVFNYSTGARYWPANGETLDFFALVDNDKFGEAGTFVFDGGPHLSGKLDQKGIAEMPDLLYATAFDKSYTGPRVAQHNVSFEFHHALAKVEVTAQVKNPNLRVCITGIEICGVTDGGNFALPKKTGEGEKIVIEGASWTVSANLNASVDGALDRTVILDMDETAKDVLIGRGATSNPKNDNLLMIPNNYNGRNSSTNQTYIKLTGYAYNISGDTFDADTDRLIYPKYDDPVKGTFTPATMIVPIEFNWQMGTVNRYNIVFDCGNGGSVDPDPNHPAFIRIGYEVEVKDWSNGQTIDPEEYKK